MPDHIYGLTRRRGARVTVVQVGEVEADPTSGQRTIETQVTNLRHVVKEPTSYGRVIKANAVQQDIGDTTFIIWTGDTLIRRLTAEDYLIKDLIKYQVVTSAVEETALVITAKEVRGAVGKQAVSVNASNSFGLDPSAPYSVS